MKLFGEQTEWADAGFEMGDEAGAEVEKADERVEGLASGGKGRVAHKVELGGGGAVASSSQIEPDPFDTVKKEVAFLGVE